MHARSGTLVAMRALVTGSRGFVGTHLVAHLNACADDVIEVDRVIGSPPIEDAGAIAELIAETKPDAVYHLAGQSDVAASWSDPMGTFLVNADGTLNVVRACIDAGVERLLAVTSSDIYGMVGPDELPITEHAPLRPVNPYAASKAAAEMVCIQGFLGHGLGVIRARAFNHLGPGQSERFLAPALAARIARNELSRTSVVPVGNLSARRDFTDVRDVVRAYRLLVIDGEPGEAYNVCSGRDVAVSEIAKILLDLAKFPMSLEQDDRLFRPVDLPVQRGDNAKLRATTGWAPEIDLTDTLTDTLEDARNAQTSQTGDSHD
ncbi:MAG: NAD-dependent epimerase/dehydratase family protein [Acidimicrobiia bacterium]|nr:NAD-dependent epimerase/dehydratase family protein [Acidimicrobiia bacterium]MYG60140.1 NAD-dependent epimerase/dehydratase family protein [Acidimicrobiia bacterium]MYJ32308.1 NAD-dependent epimerase/dehydratase family protein [Acidimicrobiia bacterium]